MVYHVLHVTHHACVHVGDAPYGTCGYYTNTLRNTLRVVMVITPQGRNTGPMHLVMQYLCTVVLHHLLHHVTCGVT